MHVVFNTDLLVFQRVFLSGQIIENSTVWGVSFVSFAICMLSSKIYISGCCQYTVSLVLFPLYHSMDAHFHKLTAVAWCKLKVIFLCIISVESSQLL